MLRIADVIDLHCHFGPDTIGGPERPASHSVSAVEAAREAAESGHRALVLKSHSFASPSLATALEDIVEGLRVFGGICTDYISGGLNVEAVDSALRLGAKIVWLPTVHSRYDVAHGKGELLGLDGPGIDVIDGEGKVLDVVREIFDLVRAHDAVLATGHVGPDEHFAVVKEFAGRGKVLVTHAGEELSGPKLTPAQCAELADLGAVIELTALSCKDVMDSRGKSPREMGQMIATIGYERCTLSSDYGWTTIVPRPAPGLQEFFESLWAEGITEDQLTTMASRTPARLLGL